MQGWYTLVVNIKFIHGTKTNWKIRHGQKSLKKEYKMHILHTSYVRYTHTKHAIMHIDLSGNTHTLKVDRNLQWMSHHPTNPTYNPVLSGTMTHLSAQCQKTAPPGHTIQMHTPRRCVLAIWYTVCQHSENVTTVLVVPNATDHPNN